MEALKQTLRVLLASALMMAYAATPARADADLQVELSRYVQAKDFYAKEGAQQKIIKRVFEKTSDWDESSIKRFVSLCQEIDATLTAQFPSESAELTMLLQEEFERITLIESIDERYHQNHALAYNRRRNVQLVASTALTVLLPALWVSKISKGAQVAQASASLSQLAWQGLKYWANRAMTVAAVGSGTALVAAPAFGKTLTPPAPAEIMSLGVRNAQDLRWEEARAALDGGFISDLYGAGYSMLFHFTLARIGGGAALPTITAEASGLATFGIGAAVLTSGFTTYYFAKKIKLDKWSQQRDRELQSALMIARKRARSAEASGSARERLEAIGTYILAAQRLEAFWLREELVTEGLLRVARRETSEDREALLELATQAANLQAERFSQRDVSRQTLSQLGEMLRWKKLEETTKLGPELALSLELSPSTLDWIHEYQSQQSLQQDLFGKRAIQQSFAEFVEEKRRSVLYQLASPFSDEVALNGMFGVQEPVALVAAVGAELALSSDPWIRSRGESVLHRAQIHRAARAEFMGEAL